MKQVASSPSNSRPLTSRLDLVMTRKSLLAVAAAIVLGVIQAGVPAQSAEAATNQPDKSMYCSVLPRWCKR